MSHIPIWIRKKQIQPRQTCIPLTNKHIQTTSELMNGKCKKSRRQDHLHKNQTAAFKNKQPKFETTISTRDTIEKTFHKLLIIKSLGTHHFDPPLASPPAFDCRSMFCCWAVVGSLTAVRTLVGGLFALELLYRLIPESALSALQQDTTFRQQQRTTQQTPIVSFYLKRNAQKQDQNALMVLNHCSWWHYYKCGDRTKKGA